MRASEVLSVSPRPRGQYSRERRTPVRLLLLVLLAAAVGIGCGDGGSTVTVAASTTQAEPAGEELVVPLSVASVKDCLDRFGFTYLKTQRSPDLIGIGFEDRYGDPALVFIGSTNRARNAIARQLARREDTVARTVPSGEAALVVSVDIDDQSIEYLNACTQLGR